MPSNGDNVWRQISNNYNTPNRLPGSTQKTTFQLNSMFCEKLLGL